MREAVGLEPGLLQKLATHRLPGILAPLHAPARKLQREPPTGWRHWRTSTTPPTSVTGTTAANPPLSSTPYSSRPPSGNSTSSTRKAHHGLRNMYFAPRVCQRSSSTRRV